MTLLKQLAHMRAALFKFNPPPEFVAQFLHDRIFDFKPESAPIAVAATREFWIAEFEAKIEATIGKLGDMIGWESDEEIVGPRALAAKASLLRAVPYILPEENSQSTFYRHVLEHGDFGIHNTTITEDTDGQPLVTSLYDWETGCIVPAILAEALVAVSSVDLVTDESGNSALARLPLETTSLDHEIYKAWAKEYIKVSPSQAEKADFLSNQLPMMYRNFLQKPLNLRLGSKQQNMLVTCGLP